MTFCIRPTELLHVSKYVTVGRPGSFVVQKGQKKLSPALKAEVWSEERHRIVSNRELKRMANARRVDARNEQRKHWRKHGLHDDGNVRD